LPDAKGFVATKAVGGAGYITGMPRMPKETPDAELAYLQRKGSVESRMGKSAEARYLGPKDRDGDTKRSKARASNQKSAAAFPAPSVIKERDSETVSHRKIENGHIVTHSGVKGGEYFHREYFSPKKPALGVPPMTKPKGAK
jgi:hypothetical protein